MRSLLPMACLIAFLVAALLGSVPPTLAQSGWSTDPMENTPVCLDYEYQIKPKSVTDGAGGMIIVWEDEREASTHLYAQRLNANGYGMWQQNGIRVCTYDSEQDYHQVASDGEGGVYVVWVDGTSNTNIYAQRISQGGALLWPASGAAVCTYPDDQSQLHIATSSSGDVLVAWDDERDGDDDIYLQKLDATGQRVWPAAGVLLDGSTGNQHTSGVVSDTAGGAIVIWRNDVESQETTYVQRVNSQGTPLWEAGGQRVTENNTYDELSSTLVSDGEGGAIIAIFYAGTEGDKIRLFHLDAYGDHSWSYWGLDVNDGVLRDLGPVELIADGQGGVIATWADVPESQILPMAQRLTASGQKLWGNNGVLLRAAAGSIDVISSEADGFGGALVCWRDGQYNGNSLGAQRVAADGGLLWGAAGTMVNIGSFGGFFAPEAVADGEGGMLVAWSDNRAGYNDDIYAQKVDASGFLANPAPNLTAVDDFPNDQGGRVVLSWQASYLDVIQYRNVERYSVWMRAEEAQRGAADPDTVAARAAGLAMSPEQIELLLTEGWNYVLELPATLAPEYGCFAPTFGDSSSAGVPMAEFKVIAHGEEVWWLWESNVRSGYSVDNVAPGAPLALSGDLQPGGEVLLSWEASGHHDEDLEHYGIYRGEAADFPLDEDHLITTSVEPDHTDTPGSGTHYYRVTAIDVHGNESTGSNEVQVGGATAVAELPTHFALHANSPNPFNPRTTIRFDLPEAAPVLLRVHDLAGRPVCTLVAGELRGAGRHEVSWNGRNDRGATVAAGVYFYRLVAGHESETRTMVLIK